MSGNPQSETRNPQSPASNGASQSVPALPYAAAGATLDYAPAQPPQPSLIRNLNFILLWAAYGISAFGDHLSEMGLLKLQHALEADVEDVTRRQAIMIFAFMFPFFALGPVCGWLADRLPRKWIMIAADVIRAVIMFELLAVLMTCGRWWIPGYRPGDALPMWIAVSPLLAIGIFAAVFSPARPALLATIVEPGKLIRANALMAGLGMIASIASFAVGGILIETVGVNWNFRIDAFTFVASAACLLMIRPPPNAGRVGAFEHGLTALANGFRYVASHRRVIEIIGMAVVLWTASAIVRSIVPTLVKNVFGGSYQDIGIYQALIGLGLVLGSVVLTLFGSALRSEIAVSWSLKLAGLSGLMIAATAAARWDRMWCAAGLVLVGFFGAGIQVSVNTLLQRTVPNHMRGRIFGVHDLCTMGGLLAATGLLGIPRWTHIDRFVVPLMAATSIGLIAAGLGTTVVRLKRGRFGRVVTFWRNLNEFYCRLWHRVEVDGICTIPFDGPVIVAANHISSIDPLLLVATSRNRLVSFMIAREYAELPVFGRLVRVIECVPVNRTGIDTASIKTALRHLEQGRCLGIFPEGRIVRPGEAPQVRKGVGLLALHSGATVIPAFISGIPYTDGVVWPFLRRHRARVRYGPPVDLSAWSGREPTRDDIRAAAERIMQAVRELGPAHAGGGKGIAGE